MGEPRVSMRQCLQYPLELTEQNGQSVLTSGWTGWIDHVDQLVHSDQVGPNEPRGSMEMTVPSTGVDFLQLPSPGLALSCPISSAASLFPFDLL